VFISLVLPRTPADAVTCGQKSVQAWTNNTNGNTTHYGVKAAWGIWVPDSPPQATCVRISSILTVHNGLNFVEIGWFQDPTRINPSCDYPSGGTAPRRLIDYKLNGNFVCLWGSNPPIWNPTNDFEPANVHEVFSPSNCSPTNNEWQWVDDGANVIAAVDILNFCQGYTITNGERWSSSDAGKAEFSGLNIYGASQSWTPWTDSHVCLDTDSGFDNVFDSSNPAHVQVKSPSDTQDLDPCY